MVLFDTCIAAIAFDEHAAVPLDPTTQKPITRCRERIEDLLSKLEQARQRVMLPTPVLAEYLVRAGPDKHKRLNEIVSNKAFIIPSFDIKAAVECALLEEGGKCKKLSPEETKAKVKFDRQIIAIAIARSARVIYTGDDRLGRKAKECGLSVVYTWELPLPPPVQLNLTDQFSSEAAPPAVLPVPRTDGGVSAPTETALLNLGVPTPQATTAASPEIDDEHQSLWDRERPVVNVAEVARGGEATIREGTAQTNERLATATGAATGDVENT